MPVTFFEKIKNLSLDASLRSKLTLNGDLINYLKNSKNALDMLSKENNQPVVQDNSKRSLSIQLKSDDSLLITGLRLKLDLSNSRNGQVPYVRVYNRQVHV